MANTAVSTKMSFPGVISAVVAHLENPSPPLTAPESMVDLIVNALLADLDTLCELVRQGGEVPRKQHATDSYRPAENFPSSVAGSYYGFGLGQTWLNLGFLEESVVSALRAKFEEWAIPGGTQERALFFTRRGVYELSRTYCWFVYKRS